LSIEHIRLKGLDPGQSHPLPQSVRPTLCGLFFLLPVADESWKQNQETGVSPLASNNKTFQ
jgi:hypothetical protein